MNPELQAAHERVLVHHAAFMKRTKVIMLVFYVAAIVLFVSLFSHLVNPPTSGSCTTSLCVISPWLGIVLIAIAVVFAAMAERAKERGIRTGSRAIKIIRSLQGRQP